MSASRVYKYGARMFDARWGWRNVHAAFRCACLRIFWIVNIAGSGESLRERD